MKVLKTSLLVALVSTLSACSLMDNRSLEYKNAQQLAPLDIANIEYRPLPLYPAPVIESEALEKSQSFTNERGNRYQLPRPTESQVETAQLAFTTDAKNNPMLAIASDVSRVFNNVQRVVGQLGYNVVETGANTIKIQQKGQTYTLYVTQVQQVAMIALFDENGQFADQKTAQQVLTQIYRNW